MNLDVGDRVFDFYCENRADRDEWFEALKNSRRTAKEYQASITKHPRNIDLLNTYFTKGEKDFYKKMGEEKQSVTGKSYTINEFNLLEFTLNNFRYLIESTLDGCLVNNPQKLDILSTYCTYMDTEYIEIIKNVRIISRTYFR